MVSDAHSLNPTSTTSDLAPPHRDRRTLRSHFHKHVAQGLGIVFVLGIALGFALPRGAVTAWQALVMLMACLATGIAAGYLSRSRWMIPFAPLTCLVAVDLSSRLADDLFAGVEHLASNSSPSLGEVIFFTVFDNLITFWMNLLPLALGASWGAAIARRQHRTAPSPTRRHRIGLYIRRAMSGLLAAALVAMSVWLFLPASVPPVVDAQGNTIPGSISELTKVTLGEHEQWIEIRGASEDLPVLLYLQRGPARTDMALSRVMLDDLTDDVIVVGWDQRGSGKSYTSLDPQTLTLDGVVADTVELTNYLRERFGEDKIYLMGQDWGSTIAVLAAAEHPELYHAVITGSQVVDRLEGSQRAWENAIYWAERNGYLDQAEQLREAGAPPYDDLSDYGLIDSIQEVPLPEEVSREEYEASMTDETREYARRDNSVAGQLLALGGSEFTLMDRVNGWRFDAANILLPQWETVDLRTDAAQLIVPIYIFRDQHERAGNRELTDEWLAIIDAPVERVFTYETIDGDPENVLFRRYSEVERILVETILPATYPGTS